MVVAFKGITNAEDDRMKCGKYERHLVCMSDM